MRVRKESTMTAKQIALRVVVFQEDEFVCAQCLEYDIAAEGKTLDDCLYQLGRTVIGHVAISAENDLEPFHGLKRAPQRFWDWFEQSKIPLTGALPVFTGDELTRQGVIIEPPDIRVAQPHAA